jgi:hypothetical protein
MLTCRTQGTYSIELRVRSTRQLRCHPTEFPESYSADEENPNFLITSQLIQKPMPCFLTMLPEVRSQPEGDVSGQDPQPTPQPNAVKDDIHRKESRQDHKSLVQTVLPEVRSFVHQGKEHLAAETSRKKRLIWAFACIYLIRDRQRLLTVKLPRRGSQYTMVNVSPCEEDSSTTIAHSSPFGLELLKGDPLDLRGILGA